MHSTKIDLPIPPTVAAPSLLAGLTTLFGAAQKPETAEINGCNYFHGTTDIAFLETDYRVAMYIENKKDWREAWHMIGIAPPGDLPKGTHAQMMLYARKGRDVTFDLHTITKRSYDTWDLNWSIESTPAAEEKTQHHFAVVLLPAQRNGIANNYSGPTEPIRPPGQAEKNLSPKPA